MSRYSKWLGGAVGWALIGPIGGLIGFALGSLLDSADTRAQLTDEKGKTYTPDGFTAALLVLTAAVMKADGQVRKSELEYVKNFFKAQFGADKMAKDMLVLREILKKDFSLAQVARQIQASTEHPVRLQLLHYLMGIAHADGNIDVSEEHVLRTIASYLNINASDFQSLRAMFGSHSIKDAYTILEIQDDCTDEEVRKAYRKMAAKYHPDKVSSLGEEHVKAAEEKFKQVQAAFAQIKKGRNMQG